MYVTMIIAYSMTSRGTVILSDDHVHLGLGTRLGVIAGAAARQTEERYHP